MERTRIMTQQCINVYGEGKIYGSQTFTDETGNTFKGCMDRAIEHFSLLHPAKSVKLNLNSSDGKQ